MTIDTGGRIRVGLDQTGGRDGRPYILIDGHRHFLTPYEAMQTAMELTSVLRWFLSGKFVPPNGS